MKQKRIPIIFLYLIGLSLLYGGWLYASRYIVDGHYKKIQLSRLARPATISSTYEADLTRVLSRGNHWTVNTLAWVKTNGLQTGLTRKVLPGREGWLFLQQEDGRPIIQQSLGVYRYSPYELKAWSLLLLQRNYWAKLQGMDYVLVIPPNKSTIYPEYLPQGYRKVDSPLSREQLQQALPDLHIIDLTDSVRAHKHKGLLYAKNDTHWNELGAFFAYQAAMRALPTPYRDRPLDLTACELTTDTVRNGDLARMILEEGEEIVPRLNIRQSAARFVEERSQVVAANLRPLVYVHPDTTLPRVFFDHDSFFKGLEPFFAEHFSASTFLWNWQGFHSDLITREQPQLIIDEFVDRSLIGLTPRNEWPVVQTYWSRHFRDLPLLAKFENLTFPELTSELNNLSIPEGTLPIIEIKSKPRQTDKLVIDYGDEQGFYWLREAGDTYYLEYPPGQILGFRVENDTPCRIEVEVRGY